MFVACDFVESDQVLKVRNNTSYFITEDLTTFVHELILVTLRYIEYR